MISLNLRKVLKNVVIEVDSKEDEELLFNHCKENGICIFEPDQITNSTNAFYIFTYDKNGDNNSSPILVNAETINDAHIFKYSRNEVQVGQKLILINVEELVK